MGACATKPKTLEGKAPEEGPVETSKVAPETTTVSTDQVMTHTFIDQHCYLLLLHTNIHAYDFFFLI